MKSDPKNLKFDKTRFNWIDSLRGIAILLVCLVHALVLSHSSSFFGFGQRGVQLFYMVSALTLWTSWDYRKYESKPVIYFAIRRFFRIFPVFYLAIFLNIVVLQIEKSSNVQLISTPHQNQFDWTEILQGVFFLHGLSPSLINSIAIGGWSIAVEASFYCVLPVLFKIVKNFRTSFILLLFSLIICPAISYFLSHRYPLRAEYFTFMWFPIQFPIFCMGILIYYLRHQLLNLRNLTDRKLLSFFSTFSGTLLFFLIPTKNETLYLSSIALMLIVLGVSVYPIRFYDNKPLRFFGKISYSFYLLHFFTFIFLAKITVLLGLNDSIFASDSLILNSLGLFGTWLTAVVLTTPLAFVSYKRIEEPMITIGQKLILNLDRRRGSNPIGH